MNLARRDGFTYMEVLLTLPILLTSLFAATLALIGSMNFTQNARSFTQAMNFGMWRLEQIRNTATLPAGIGEGRFSTEILRYSPNGTAPLRYRFPSVFPAAPEAQAMLGLGISTTQMEAVSRVAAVGGSGDLYDVTVVVCFRDKGGRVVGEDTNFNGVLDAGEDRNANAVMDSPVSFRTLVARK